MRSALPSRQGRENEPLQVAAENPDNWLLGSATQDMEVHAPAMSTLPCDQALACAGDCLRHALVCWLPGSREGTLEGLSLPRARTWVHHLCKPGAPGEALETWPGGAHGGSWKPAALVWPS